MASERRGKEGIQLIGQKKCRGCGVSLDAGEQDTLIDELCATCRETVVKEGDSDHSDLLIGQLLDGRIRVDSLISGLGGQGAVYRGTNVELQRVVAVKVSKHVIAADVRNSLKKEANLLAQLEHPNIVSIFGCGLLDDQRFYMEMELVDGSDLATYMHSSNFDEKQAARICLDVSKALEYAHKREIIHRDVKPGNILMTKEGRAKLSDFGVAKYDYGDGQTTVQGEFIGSPWYAAPEQFYLSSDVSVRSDVFSLGIVLYELLTKTYPYDLSQVRDIVDHGIIKVKSPAQPRSHRQSISKEIEHICMKCIRPTPDDRYASAHELAIDLQRFISDKPLANYRTHFWVHASKWYRRNPDASWIAAGVSALLLGILLMVWALTGIALHLFGFVGSEISFAEINELLMLFGLFYLPITVSGFLTLLRYRWPLLLVETISLLGMILIVMLVAGTDVLDGFFPSLDHRVASPRSKMQMLSLVFWICSILFASHTHAIFQIFRSWWKDRRKSSARSAE